MKAYKVQNVIYKEDLLCTFLNKKEFNKLTYKLLEFAVVHFLVKITPPKMRCYRQNSTTTRRPSNYSQRSYPSTYKQS